MTDWESIIPFIVIIPIAIWTKQVIPALILGLLTASYIIDPTILGGFDQMVSFIIDNLAKENKLLVIGFLYVFAGLINMIKMTGGIKGFIELTSNKINTKKQALFLIWISFLGTFTSPNLRIVTIAPIMKALQQQIDIPKKRLSFVIEATALPIVAIIPVATAFIGYMTSIIDQSLQSSGIQGDPYALLIKSIPFNFFSLITIILAAFFSFFSHPQFFSRPRKEQLKDPSSKKKVWENSHSAVSNHIESKPINIIIPLTSTLLLTVFLSWWDGYQQTSSVLKAFIASDVTRSMFIAILISVMITFIQLLIEKYPLKKLVHYFFDGGSQLLPAFVLFSLVWGLSSATNELGLSNFVTNSIGWIPTLWIPPVTFVLGSVLSYFIGSSWGSWGLLMPIGVSLASSSNLSLPLMIGVIFASGTFGGLTSPLSGTTITMSKIMELEVLDYAKYKLKHSIITISLSVILYSVITFIM